MEHYVLNLKPQLTYYQGWRSGNRSIWKSKSGCEIFSENPCKEYFDQKKNPKLRVYTYFHSSFSPTSSHSGAYFLTLHNLNIKYSIIRICENTKKPETWDSSLDPFFILN